MKYPVTPDGRYFAVRGRLWRMSDPALDAQTRALHTADLMRARRDVAAALRSHDDEALRVARSRVHAAKLALGERGPPWWRDGAPDFGRRMARNTPYAAWHAALDGDAPGPGAGRDAPGASVPAPRPAPATAGCGRAGPRPAPARARAGARSPPAGR